MLSNEQLIETNYSFWGSDETEIRCRTVRVVKVRKPQTCFCMNCEGGKGHPILPGELAVADRAIADGKWGTNYTCTPCLEAWYRHCEKGKPWKCVKVH